MRRVTDAFRPLVRGQAEVGPLFLIGIVTHLGNDVAGLVQNRDSPLQLGKDRVIAPDVHRGRHPQILLNDFYEVTVEIPVLHPIVIAVANE